MNHQATARIGTPIQAVPPRNAVREIDSTADKPFPTGATRPGRQETTHRPDYRYGIVSAGSHRRLPLLNALMDQFEAFDGNGVAVSLEIRAGPLDGKRACTFPFPFLCPVLAQQDPKIVAFVLLSVALSSMLPATGRGPRGRPSVAT